MRKVAVLYPSLKLKTFWVKELLESLKDHSLFIITGKSDKQFIAIYRPWILHSLKYIFFKKMKDFWHINFLDFVLARKLKSKNIEVLIINFLTQAIKYDKLIQLYSSKVLIHVHGKDITWDFVDPISGLSIYNESYKNKALALSEKVYFVANSEYSKNQLLKVGICPSKIFVKYFGMDLRCKTPRKFPESEMKILFLGRLIDTKNPIFLIKSFIKAKDFGLRGKLTVAGDGELYKNCETIIKGSQWEKDIRLPGWVNHSEANALYQSHDLFVLPNRRGEITNQEEAFGLVFLEAMSYGLPVVGGKSGGVPEIIRNGENGFLLENEQEDLIQILIKLENDPNLYYNLSLEAINTIKNKFSKKNEKARMNEIIEKIIRQP